MRLLRISVSSKFYQKPGVALPRGVDRLQHRVDLIILYILAPCPYQCKRPPASRTRGPALGFQSFQVLDATPAYNA